MKWVGHVAYMVERRDMYNVSVTKVEEKRPLGRPRRKWKDNVKMELQEVGYGAMDWIDLSQDRDRHRTFVNAIKKLSGSTKSGNFLTS
jgi:hypothetical protein